MNIRPSNYRRWLRHCWHDLKHIQRAIQESYQIFHTQKIFERNGTLETRLALKTKQNRSDFTIKWSIIKKSISYTGGSKRCNSCLEEKISILKEKNNCLLNKRSEIVSACQHKSRFQVNNLNKERNACYSTTHAPTFPP